MTAVSPRTTTDLTELSVQPVGVHPAGMLDISEQWRAAIWGQDIGLGRIAIVDIDGDSRPEIVLAPRWPMRRSRLSGTSFLTHHPAAVMSGFGLARNQP